MTEKVEIQYSNDYGITWTGTGVYVVYEAAAAVAKVTVNGSDTFFTNFYSAWSEADKNDGSTLTLLEGVTQSDLLTCIGHFTLDLNGKTLTLGFGLVNTGTLVIRNGSITFAYAYVENYNALTIENSSITSTTKSGYAVYNPEGTVSVSKSTISADGTGLRNDGTATISDSTITGGSYGVSNSGTLNLSGALTLTGTEKADLDPSMPVNITGALTGNDTFTVCDLYDGKWIAVGNGYLTEADVSRFVSADEGYVTYYKNGDIKAKAKELTVTLALTNMTGNQPASNTVKYGDNFAVTLTANNGYFLPATVTVTDGVDYEYNASTGNLTISSVTKDVTITAEATACDHPKASLSYQQSTTEQHYVTCAKCDKDWYENHKDYTISAAGGTLTATCKDCGTDYATLMISAGGRVYDGTAGEANVYGSIPGVETPEIVYAANDGGKLTDGKPVNAGSYTASITLDGQTASVTYEIGKAQASVTEAPVGAMLTYNGGAQALLTNPGTAQGGTMVYSLTWDGEYTETIPTATEARDYIVRYYVKGDSNHNDSTVDLVSATIAKATPSVPDLPTLYATYGDTLAGVELPKGFSWGDPAHKVDGVGTSTYYVAYNLGDADNYNTVDVLATIEVEPKKITVTANPVTKTYGDDDPELTYTVSGLEEGDQLYNSLARESGSDVGEYAITQGTLNANENYTISFTGSAFTIQPRALTVAVSDQTIVYGDQISVTEYHVAGLVPGDTAYVTLTPSTSNVTTNGAITATVSIRNGRGDATNNYTISCTTGKLVIQPDTSAIDGLTTDNVTSAEAADIEAVQKMLEDADSVAEEWKEISKVCEALLEKIAAVDAENVRLREAADSYSLGTVKSSDEEAIAQFLSEIKDQLKTDNLTDDERTTLEGLETKCENLLAQIESTEALIDQLDTTVSNMDADSVTSTDKAALEQVIADAQGLIHSNNVTDDEREALEQIVADAEKLIDVIDSVANEVEEVTQRAEAFDDETVKSTDKAALEQLAGDITALLKTDNLSDKERTALEDLLDEVMEYLEVIEDTANNSKYATDTIQKLDEKTVNSGDKAELEEALDTIEELLSGKNLTEEERKALEEAREEAEKLLDIIDAAASAADTENTKKVEDVTAENVKPGDKEALEAAKADLEKALEENGDNYTKDEKQAIRDEIQRIEDALEALENVEDVTEIIAQLPKTVEPDDEETAQEILDAKEAYDSLTDHEKSLVDETSKKKLDDLVAALTAYAIIKGDGSKWTKGSSTGLSFTANGPFGKFDGIEIDGKEIATKYYSAKSGSTVITLKASYLNKLDVGKHTITVLYTDGEASGTFTIRAKATSPETGDDSNIGLWTSVLCVSTLGLAVLLLDSKRRRIAK